MRIILITKDPQLAEAARQGCAPYAVESFEDWQEALAASSGTDLMFVDMLATLRRPHEIAGYESFAQAKMAHSEAKGVPLILISPPPDYDLDYLVGWEGFVTANLQRPVEAKLFRRATTWV